MPAWWIASSGAFQWAGTKSSLKTRFTFTPNTSLDGGAAPASATGRSASASTASISPLRTISGDLSPFGRVCLPRPAAQQGAGAHQQGGDQHHGEEVETGRREVAAGARARVG